MDKATKVTVKFSFDGFNCKGVKDFESFSAAEKAAEAFKDECMAKGIDIYSVTYSHANTRRNNNVR